MAIKLGFSTGTFYRHCDTAEALQVFKNNNISVVELGFLKPETIMDDSLLEQITPELLKNFEYVSLHAPKFVYKDNEQTKSIFERIERINSIRKLDAVVFHPDLVEDFDIFNQVGFQVAFENMDNRKKIFKTPRELENLVSKNEKFNAVLDLNHVYVNDNTMSLAEEFHKTIEDKLVEYHISGYKELHDPLYLTKQLEIINAIQRKDIPIIVESVLSLNEISLEKEYVSNYL